MGYAARLNGQRLRERVDDTLAKLADDGADGILQAVRLLEMAYDSIEEKAPTLTDASIASGRKAIADLREGASAAKALLRTSGLRK